MQLTTLLNIAERNMKLLDVPYRTANVCEKRCREHLSYSRLLIELKNELLQ